MYYFIFLVCAKQNPKENSTASVNTLLNSTKVDNIRVPTSVHYTLTFKSEA